MECHFEICYWEIRVVDLEEIVIIGVCNFTRMIAVVPIAMDGKEYIVSLTVA